MKSRKEINPGIFYFLFFILLSVVALAGKVMIDLKTLEKGVIVAEGQWISLHETSMKLFSFSSFRARHERSHGLKEIRNDIKKDLENWRILRDQFEDSLQFFERSPYKILLDPETVKHVHGAWEAWSLTKKKLQNSKLFFEKVMSTPVGEKLVAYSYKELIEDAVLKDSDVIRHLSKNDLFLFYRLQDSLGDLEISGGVFQDVLTHISEEISRRIMGLIILIGFIVFFIAIFIVGIVTMMAREVQENQRKFQAIFDQTFQLIGLMTPEGILLEANRTALDFSGIQLSDVFSKPFWTAPWWSHSKKVQEEIRASIRRAAGGEFVRYETTILAQGGEVRHVDFSIKTVKNEHQKVVLLIPEGRDVTQRKMAEDALRESEERFRRIIEKSPLAMAIVSMDEVIEYINQKAIQVFGYSPEDIPNMDRWWTQAYPDENYRKEVVATWMGLVQAAIAEKCEIKAREYRVTCKDRTVKTVVISGVFVVDKVFVLFEDITRRKKEEEESKGYHERLEESIRARTLELTQVNERLVDEINGHRKTELELKGSREYLDKIINSIADPIFVKDRDHKWILLNDVFCEFMGKKREELLGKGDYDFFHEKEADVFWAKDEEVFNSGLENINEEFFTDGTGKTRTIITKKTLYTDNASQKILVGIIRDITEIRNKSAELKNAYEQLVAFQDRMVQAEKMASLGHLAAGIAHEINNPTAYILCNLSVLRGYEEKMGAFIKSLVALSPDLERHEQLAHRFDIPKIMEDCPALVEETIRGAERIKKIVQDLRVFAHPEVGGLEYGDLHRCIDGALGIIGSELTQKVDVIKQYGPIPSVCFKEQQMLQVFINLLSNAAQAIEDHGSITIKTYADKKNIFVEIADTGRGIPEDVLLKIFDPFFTTKPVGQGTGLGLSIVHGIIEQHQGKISVKSKVGQGTIFTISLLREGPKQKSA